MLVDRLLEHARPCYDNGDPSHDFEHVRRVVASCEQIGKQLGADLELLIPAAILHDIVTIPKNHPERDQASTASSHEAMKILRDFGIAEVRIQAIAQIIVEHSYSRGLKPSSLEAAILQDADRLDAIGAIGIARVFSCGTRMGSAFYAPGDRKISNRPLDDRAYMLDHFYVKLLRLPALMNTEPGRIEAKKRLQIMTEFLEAFSRELNWTNSSYAFPKIVDYGRYISETPHKKGFKAE